MKYNVIIREFFLIRKAGRLETRDEITVSIDKNSMGENKTFVIHYRGGNIHCEIPVRQQLPEKLKEMTFVETDGIIAIEAEHYAEAESGRWWKV